MAGADSKMLSDKQLQVLSKYLSDISKIVFGSVVIGFFIHTSESTVSLQLFIFGIVFAIITFGLSLNVIKKL